MNLSHALFAFNGRLNRKPYWIASLVLIVPTAAILILIVVASMHTMNQAVAYWPSLALQVAVLYPAAAIMAKRFQDRGKSGWLVLLLIVPVLVQTFGELSGFLGKTIPLGEIMDKIDFEAGELSIWWQSMQIEARYRPVDLALHIWVFIVCIWFIIEQGFLRGTKGPNAYGPDPLAAPAG